MASAFDLAESVRSVHASLRDELRKGEKSPEAIWREHLTKKSLLVEYASCMHDLATVSWATKHDNNRISWCVDTIRDYFRDGLRKALMKELRRLDHGMPTIVDHRELPKTEQEIVKAIDPFISKPTLKLLDVGSCYNPFSRFEEFEVVAVDIAPAVESVIYCDFLNASIGSRSSETPPCEDPPNESTKQVLSCCHPGLTFQEQSFDVVVFCLLLSYFPHPAQRLKCCSNAHKILRTHGLLLIVTPDSSHQNRHAALMKQWKSGIEGLGFSRWKYSKEQHLHCMAFRKVTSATGICGDDDRQLAIPQDNHKVEVLLNKQPDTKDDSESTTNNDEYHSTALLLDVVNLFKFGQDDSYP